LNLLLFLKLLTLPQSTHNDLWTVGTQKPHKSRPKAALHSPSQHPKPLKKRPPRNLVNPCFCKNLSNPLIPQEIHFDLR